MAMGTRGELTVVRTSRLNRGTREAETKFHRTTTGAEMPLGNHGMAEGTTTTKIRALGTEEQIMQTRMTAPGTTTGNQGMAEGATTTRTRMHGTEEPTMEIRTTAPGTTTGEEIPPEEHGMVEGISTTKTRTLGMVGAMGTRTTAPGTTTAQQRLRGTLAEATIREGESGSWSDVVRTDAQLTSLKTVAQSEMSKKEGWWSNGYLIR